MSLRISQWVRLIGVAATIPLVQTVAIAKTPVEVNNIATSITVLITEANGVNGSGVIIQHQGDIYTVLTAAHVVSKQGSYTITAPDDNKYEVISNSSVSAPGDMDLAVVKFKATTNYRTAKLGNSNLIKGGMDIYIAGFPGKDKAFSKWIMLLKKGMVEANGNQAQRHGYSLVYDNYTLPGMSGGAVLNTNGELVGIHGEGNVYKDGRNNATNLAIPINRFGTVATRMGVNLNGQLAAIPEDKTLTADDYYASGLQKYNYSPKDYQGALVDFNRAIQLKPNFARAYVARAELKVSLNNNGNRKIFNGNNQDALADLNRAIQIDPNEYTYYERATLKRDRMKDFKGAIVDYNRLIQINPNKSYYYSHRGECKENLNDFQGALTDYNRAIEIRPNQIIPNDSDYYITRAHLKVYKLNDAQGALTDYNRFIQLIPNDKFSVYYTSYYIERGMLKYTKLNDFQGALADFNWAIQLRNHDAYKQIALVKYDLGDLSVAIQSWRKFLSYETESYSFLKSEPQLGLAIALYKQGQESEAYVLAAKVIREEKRVTSLDFLRKEYEWSDIILKDAAKFFQTPKMRSIR
jgi:tetratricopeptide (TPR) repeat protein